MDIIDRIRLIWPEVSVQDVIQIGPLGSRRTDNVLLYNRRDGRVSTGIVSTPQSHACFEGSLGEFEAKVNQDYGAKVAAWNRDTAQKRHYERLWHEYKLVCGFLSSLPPLEEEA